MRRLRLRVADLIALACWGAALAFYVVAVRVAPAGQCDTDNHDVFVVEAERAGLVLFGAALAIAAAGCVLLVAGARSTRRARFVRLLAGLLSLLAAGWLAFLALLEYVAFSCLE